MCEPKNEFPLQSLSKEERLYLKNEIDLLFSEGKWFSIREFAVVYRILPSDKNTSLLISIPKKFQKLAVQRNKSKRVIREAYRKHKNVFVEELAELGINVCFAIVCKTRTPLEYHSSSSKIILVLHRLIQQLSKDLEEI